MLTMVSISWSDSLREARRVAGLSQAELAARAGVSQKLEAGSIDARLSTWSALMRALGLEWMLVPAALAPAALQFLQAGGRALGQAEGISAPQSVIMQLAHTETPKAARKVRR
jgi:transcriptional regulator with XRE-family HTH domain